MSAQSLFEAYLAQFRERLKKLIMARGAAVLACALLIVSIAAVYVGTRRAFDPELMLAARLVLLLVIAVVGVVLFLLPLRDLRRTRGVQEIERRAPDFDGRVETFDSISRDGRKSPFLGLLAEDALKFARRLPVAMRISRRELSIPTAIAVVAAISLIWVAALGPDNWRYGMRHLWAGWIIDDTLPPQRIGVNPGDGAVRRGGDLSIEAVAEGFDPSTMEVFALFDQAGDWQSATMSETSNDVFEFTFFAVRAPLRYYVSAAGVRSQEYAIDVVDLPEVTQIRLTYEYPEWTNLDPFVEDPGYDVRAVAGTRVTVEVRTDEPLGTASLVAYDEPIEMTTEGTVATATLTVQEDGEYFIATLFNDDTVQVSSDYFITEIEDDEPTVRVVKPGRDWRASPIEEVAISVEAGDDFGLDTVQLRYSVNGGDWETIDMDVDGTVAADEALLYLEDMRQPIRERRAETVDEFDFSRPLSLEDLRALRAELEEGRDDGGEDGQEAEDMPPIPTERSLEPGDLISYYAIAEDRGQSVQTDLFFIEVQPFDRRFTQGNGGGGGGGGGGQQQDEISRRQKEILVATWNLIREQQEEEVSFLDEQQLQDNALMLAELQRTLAEQAQTLANRTRARRLTGQDERIETFVENLELAVEAMGPAAERLADVELNDAVAPEQEALQYILRAEAVFTDIQVSMQRNGGGGGGGLAGRDLSELFELEMDLEKNQYETEAPVAFDAEEGGPEEIDEAIAKLQELARRQEELARQAARRNQLTEQERWEQQSLQREAEELKRQLEQLQQQIAQAQQQQGQQQSGQQQSGQQQSGQQQGGQQQNGQQQSGQPQNGQQGAQGQQTAETIQQLEEALRAMNQAGSNDPNMDPDDVRRAIEQARRQLNEALENMTSGRQQAVAEAFSDVASRASELYADQLRSASELQRALEEAADAAGNDDGARGNLDFEEARELSEQRFAMQSELEALEADIQRIAQEFRRQTPGATEELNEALADLQQAQAIARLGIGGEYIRRGAGAQVAATDAVVSSALRDLERNTERAEELANREAVRGEAQEADPNAELVAELQSLRRQLAELTQGQQGGQQGGQQQGGQQGGQQQGGQQQGGQQAGGQQQGGAFGGQRFGGPGGGFYDPTRDAVWDPLNNGFWQDPEAVDRLREQLGIAGSDLINLGARLRGEGLSDEELEAVRRLGDALRAGLRGNPELVEAEFRNLVNLTEQLELRLAAGEDQSEAAVRTEAPATIAEGFEDVVAEYYRRLSRTEQ